MKRIRVLVVEDSLTVRKRLVEVLSSDPEIDVVGEGENGQEAILLCERLRPDVITLDMMMPVKTGLEVTEHVMAYCPTPIVIVSSSTNRGELLRTYDALAAGAVEALEKPNVTDADGSWEQRFVSKVKLVSRIRVITHLRARLARKATVTSALKPPTSERRHGPTEAERTRPSAGYRLVAIGASAGGPQAVMTILKQLPASYPLPILLVVHLSSPFGVAFAEWLDGWSSLRVSFGQDGAPLPTVGKAAVVVAPPDQHLVVKNGRIWLNKNPERHACRPSVDVLFESVALECGAQSIACLLTGMGRDGAAGLKTIQSAGGMTLVQDEATSVVFGMPREAIALGAANHVLPLDRFVPTLVSLADHSQPLEGTL